MVQVKWLSRVVYGICVLILVACKHDSVETITHNPNVVVLKWNKSYASEQLSDAVLGLNWCLSHLGALNTGKELNGLDVQGEKIRLSASLIGLDAYGQSKLLLLHKAIQTSDELSLIHI